MNCFVTDTQLPTLNWRARRWDSEISLNPEYPVTDQPGQCRPCASFIDSAWNQVLAGLRYVAGERSALALPLLVPTQP